MLNDATKHRLFIALSLPQDIRSLVTSTMENLRVELAFQKWVHPNDLHITLKFLGDTSLPLRDQVKHALERIATNHIPFRLAIHGIGTFGKPASPSVLWAGIQGELQRLTALHSDIKVAMQPIGFDKEDRAFRPHLTLARRYGEGSRFSRKMLEQVTVSGATEWKVDRIVLYRSHLFRQPMYEVLEQFDFPTFVD